MDGLNTASDAGITPAESRGSSVPPSRAGAWTRAARRALLDRIAAAAVKTGGIGIVASILAILVFIVLEVTPLLSGATVDLLEVVTLPEGNVGAVIGDEYLTHVATLTDDGVVRVVRLRDDLVVVERSVVPVAPGVDAPALVHAQAAPGSDELTAATTDGRVVVVPIDWQVDFGGGKQVVHPTVRPATVIELDPGRQPIPIFATQSNGTGKLTVAARLAGDTLAVVRRQRKENEFTGEVSVLDGRTETAAPRGLTHLLVDEEQRHLYGAGEGGNLFWWSLVDGLAERPHVVSAGTSPITALSLLLGGRSLVVGQADGSLSVWFLVPQKGGRPRLARVRDFPPAAGPIQLIAPSRRDKGFLAQYAQNKLGLYYSTSHRVLWTGQSPIGSPTAMSYAPKGNGAYLAGSAQLTVLAIDNPHPEVSLRSLFGRVWYEGYGQPEYVWQSSGGTDDFESKLSLTPLLIGTLKGTVYSLLFAIPLAVFGAMYVAQFMHPKFKGVIKPGVEIMAALPSVVLGFLAGLWLAPRIQHAFPTLLLMIMLFPVLTIGTGLVWRRLPQTLRGRLAVGSEVIVLIVVLAAGFWFSLALSDPLEAYAFGGDFQSWLLRTTELPYDQRNAIIVGLAMGFAVIPIIFAISEDAFSNVPREFVSGSLALGANRWQTVTRVVLPTASPGIFSSIMVGFGRAVGETMIVLMATGNTPIMDWNPFNGFRTLSANIAVEIPEAPQYGTLFRVLFLAALLLFVVTFIVNTAAELVRQRLRRRYAQLSGC